MLASGCVPHSEGFMHRNTALVTFALAGLLMLAPSSSEAGDVLVKVDVSSEFEAEPTGPKVIVSVEDGRGDSESRKHPDQIGKWMGSMYRKYPVLFASGSPSDVVGQLVVGSLRAAGYDAFLAKPKNGTAHVAVRISELWTSGKNSYDYRVRLELQAFESAGESEPSWERATAARVKGPGKFGAKQLAQGFNKLFRELRPELRAAFESRGFAESAGASK